MPFRFVYVCDLLQELENPFVRDVPRLPGHLREHLRSRISKWFTQHRGRLDEFRTDAGAVLSMLRPQAVKNRVYGIDPGRLELIIARALSLTKAQYAELQKWRTEPAHGDLAVRVRTVMEKLDGLKTRAQSNGIMVEDIDQALLQIAAFNQDSSFEVQSLARTWLDGDSVSLLGDLYQQLQPREAKWLTRIILKDLSPLRIPDNLELSASSGHSQLPSCLNVSITLQDFTAAAVRRDGTGMIRGTAGFPKSSALAKSTSLSSSPVHTMNASCLSTLAGTSSVALPVTPCVSGPAMSRTKIDTMQSTKQIPLLTPPASLARSVLAIPSSSKCPASRAIFHPSSAQVPLTSELPGNAILHPSAQALSTSNATRKTPRPRKVLGESSGNHSQPRSQSSNSESGIAGSLFTVGTGACQLTMKTCPIATCVFILAPCISRMPYLTENLLRWHGSHFITSTSALLHPSLPRRCSKSGKRYRMIVLVEPNRRDPTVKFLKSVAMLVSKKKDKKNWLGVYDWRLLECLGKVDQGKQLSYDSWKRCWIMAV